MHQPTHRITHRIAFVTPVMEHWLEQEIAQWVDHEGSIQRTNALTKELHLAPAQGKQMPALWKWIGSLIYPFPTVYKCPHVLLLLIPIF